MVASLFWFRCEEERDGRAGLAERYRGLGLKSKHQSRIFPAVSSKGKNPEMERCTYFLLAWAWAWHECIVLSRVCIHKCTS